MNYKSDNFQDIYINILKDLYHNPQFKSNSRTGNQHETLGLIFTLTNPLNRKVDLKSRSVREEFYEKFFQWIWSGSDDITPLLEWNPNAKDYMAAGELPSNFSTNYGPRVSKQIWKVVDELRKNPDSRRATILILEEGDNILYSIESKAEYPCTIGTQYFIRDGKLHAITHMRSNNMFTTICYDVYNFTRLQEELANILGVELGEYTHMIGSAHIFEKDFERIKGCIE